MQGSASELGKGFRIGEAQVFPATGEIRLDGELTRVEPLVMDVLSALADEQGDVVSRDALIERVWRGAAVSDDVISRCVYRLRKVLGDSDRTIIQTVPKRGYRLVTPVTPIRPDAGPVVGPPSDSTSPIRWIPAALAIAFVVAAGWLVNSNWPDKQEPAGVAIPYTIAVSSFEANTAEAEIGAGFADDLLHRLSRNPNLTVLARASSFQTQENLQRVLPDENLVTLEGSVSDENGLWIIDIRLTAVATGEKLWETRLATETLTITNIQKRIEAGVIQALNILPDGGVLADTGFASDDLEAYRTVLKGREWILSRDPALLARAGGLFGVAAGLDPDYSAAYVSMAEGAVYQATYGGVPWPELAEVSRTAIRRGLELAPDSAHAHAVDGLVHYMNGDMELAEPSLRQALRLNPGYAEAYMWLGRVYMALGRTQDAIDAYSSTVFLNPLSSTGYMNLGMAKSTMARFDEALAEYSKALELDPANDNVHWAIAYAHWRIGQLDDALEAFRVAEERGVVNADFFAQHALAAFAAGRDEKGRQQSRRAIQLDPNRLWTVRANWASLLSPQADLDALVDFFADSANRPTRSRSAGQMNLAMAYAVAGHWEDASDLYETLYLAGDPWFQYPWDAEWGVNHALVLAVVRQNLGQPNDKLLAELDEVLGVFESQQVRSAGLTYLRASAAAVRGERDVALRLMREAHAEGWRRWWWTTVDPCWSDLRGDSEFEAMIAALRAPASTAAGLGGGT